MTSAYTINLNPNITTPVKTGYTFKSGDKGITFNIAVTEMDPTGTSAKIAFHRANGTSVEAVLSGQGPTYSYTILGNEFAVPGVVVADVKFYQSTTQRVSTASFVFNVINDTLDGLGGGTAGYSDELETLSAAMEGYIEAFGNLSPINPRGAYSASTAYEPADCVSYNGNSWLCIQPCTGVTPSEGAYWQQVADMAADKADKVNGATNGNLAALNASGNLIDSGVSPSRKADKVTGATAGNFAGLDASGNLTDSGESPASLLQDYTLLGSWTGAMAWETKQLSNNLAYFREIMMCFKGNNSQVILNPVRISRKQFKGMNSNYAYLGLRAFLTTSIFVEVAMYYLTDTSVAVYMNNNAGNYEVALYGIK